MGKTITIETTSKSEPGIGTSRRVSEYSVNHPSRTYRAYRYIDRENEALVIQGDVPDGWHAESPTWNPYDDNAMPADVDRYGVLEDIATAVLGRVIRVLIFHARPGDKVDFYVGTDLYIEDQHRVYCDLMQSGLDADLIAQLHWELLEVATLCGGESEAFED